MVNLNSVVLSNIGYPIPILSPIIKDWKDRKYRIAEIEGKHLVSINDSALLYVITTAIQARNHLFRIMEIKPQSCINTL